MENKMTRRQALKTTFFGGLAVILGTRIALDKTKADEPFTNAIFKDSRWPQTAPVDYTYLLRELGGVLFTGAPCCLVDWDKMEVSPHGNPMDEHFRFQPVAVRMRKMRNLKDAVEFVERNKHQIAVFELLWHKNVLFKSDLEGTIIDPCTCLRYAQKPGTRPV